MARNLICISSIVAALALAGCPSTAEKTDNPAGQQSADHAHADVGPHGGDLIELGSDEYHAELVHPEHGEEHGADHADEAVTIYLLDGTAEKAIAVDATEVRLNMRHDGQGEQFMLAAAPQAGDAQATSSRFTSSEPSLLDLFHEEEIEGEVVVTIEGKQYRGNIEHDHHEGDDQGHAH